MKKNNIIAIIGGGNMGEALIKGLHTKCHVHVCETDAKRAQYLKKKYRIGVGDLNAVIAKSSTVILAIKPQVMEEVLSQIRQVEGKLFISIAAGLTTKFFEKHLGGKVKVVRVMPNMPALINEGITGICKGRYAANEDLKTAGKVLSVIGQTLLVNEDMMDALTAVSGSGPAYVFLFVEQWIGTAVKLGFNHLQAKQLVYKTLLGSAHLLEQSPLGAAQLRDKVTSKGGTTQAAMKVFFRGNAFGKLMQDALTAAKKRAKELAK